VLDCLDRDDVGPDAGLWVAREAGAVVGYAALSLNRYLNLDGAKIVGAVHPTRAGAAGGRGGGDPTPLPPDSGVGGHDR
jgi:hypothetical protein